MGREWLYKVGTGGDGCGKSPSTATKKRMNGKTKKEKNNSSSGCLNTIFNLFDIQNLQFRFHHPAFISESTISSSQQSNCGIQGVEASRNSLESPESAANVAPSSSLRVKEQTNLNIPMNGIQIKTKRSQLTDDISSECSNSPGTKTPNLVARLMGLDLLPEYSSPRQSSSSTPVNSHHRSRSLPTTPRMSTGSRRSTDNEYHHRLSLQIDKENRNSCSGHEHKSLQMKMARRRAELLVNRKDDDSTSEYAKQVANQVRERIGRRLGTDITNTICSRNKEQRRDSNLVLLKPKKLSNLPRAQVPVLAQETVVKAKQDDSTSYSSSPKLRLLDIKSNLNKPKSNSHSLKQHEKLVKEKKIKNIASERYDLRLKKMNQHDDDAMFASKIFKKSTSLPNHVVNVKNTTKFLAFKKEMMSPSSTTRLPQEQVSLVSMTHLPSCLNSSYNSNDNRTLNLGQHDTSQVVPNMISSYKFKSHQKRSMFELSAIQKNISNQDFNVTTTTTTTTTTTNRDKNYFDYISRIVNQCGIHTTTPISDGRWYSHSHPLHPSIYHQLEKHHQPTTTIEATKRRMLFELTNEFLIEILKPYMNTKPWVCPKPPDSCTMCGSELIEILCEKIISVPAAQCEDINGLIERHLGLSTRQLWSTAVEAEVEEMVKDIENDIVTTLVHEMVINGGNGGITSIPATSDKVRSHVLFT